MPEIQEENIMKRTLICTGTIISLSLLGFLVYQEKFLPEEPPAQLEYLTTTRPQHRGFIPEAMAGKKITPSETAENATDGILFDFSEETVGASSQNLYPGRRQLDNRP